MKGEIKQIYWHAISALLFLLLLPFVIYLGIRVLQMANNRRKWEKQGWKHAIHEAYLDLTCFDRGWIVDDDE